MNSVILAIVIVVFLARLFPRVVKFFAPPTPEELGEAGELAVHSLLTNCLDAHRYKVFYNVMLCTRRGGTTQIDHVVVSQYGIFVIETKNISGWVFASEKSYRWTSTLPALGYSRYVMNCYKYHFQNPIRQNYLHIMTIAETLKVPLRNIISIVAFPDETEFKNGYPSGVYPYSKVVEKIRGYTKTCFDVPTTRRLAKDLACAREAVSPEVRALHVANLQKAHQSA